VAEISVEASELHLNDKILIIGPTTGVMEYEVKELHVDEKPAEFSPKGIKCSIPVPEKVRRADKLYRIVKMNTK